MQTRAVIERRWLARFRSRPVSLSSPYPVEECLRRLSTVAERRGAASWYLSSRTVGCPEPRLRGDVGPSRILVAEWKAASGRNSFVPWLDARLEPDGEGRTTLRGQIGLRPEVVTVLALTAAVGGLVCMAVVVSGIAVLVHGHLSGLPLALGHSPLPPSPRALTSKACGPWNGIFPSSCGKLTLCWTQQALTSPVRPLRSLLDAGAAAARQRRALRGSPAAGQRCCDAASPPLIPGRVARPVARGCAARRVRDAAAAPSGSPASAFRLACPTPGRSSPSNSATPPCPGPATASCSPPCPGPAAARSPGSRPAEPGAHHDRTGSGSTALRGNREGGVRHRVLVPGEAAAPC